MKRVVIAFLAIMLMVSSNCSADIDLSGMSFDELIALKEQINLALWECEEWQEVVVPIGIYKVGVDIPEGYWDISAYDGQQTLVAWGTGLDDNGVSVKGIIDFGYVVSPTSNTYNEASSISNFYFQVQNGQYIQITGASAVFRTYSGKNLGFK